MSGGGGNDLRIYFGNARIIIPANDPRCARILALVVSEVTDGATPAPAAREAPGSVFAPPRDDEEYLALAADYFRRRERR
jgi:hypothetical protein